MTKKTKFALPGESELMGPTGPPGPPGPEGATGPAPALSFFIAVSSGVPQVPSATYFMLIDNKVPDPFDGGFLFSEDAFINNLTASASDFPTGQDFIGLKINGGSPVLTVDLNPTTMSGVDSVSGTGILVNAGSYISFELVINSSGTGGDISFLASIQVTPALS